MNETIQPASFEEAMNELESIVKQLEQGNLPLDQALTAFKKGIELSQYCQTSLNKAEAMVAKMMTDKGEIPLDGELS